MKKCLIILLFFMLICLVGCDKSNSDSYEGIYIACNIKDDSYYIKYNNNEKYFIQISNGQFISYKTENEKLIMIEYRKCYKELFNESLDPYSKTDIPDSQREELVYYMNEKYNIEILYFNAYKYMGDDYIYPFEADMLLRYLDGKIILVSSIYSYDEYYSVYYKKIKNI